MIGAVKGSQIFNLAVCGGRVQTQPTVYMNIGTWTDSLYTTDTLLSMPKCFWTFTLMAASESKLGFSVGRSGIKPPTFQLLDELLCLLTYRPEESNLVSPLAWSPRQARPTESWQARHSGRGYRESSKRPGPLKGVSAHLHVWALELPQCRMSHQRNRSFNEPVSVSLRALGPVWLNLWDKHMVLTGTAPRPRPRRTRPEHLAPHMCCRRPEHPDWLLSMWVPSGLTWAGHKHHSDIRLSGQHSWAALADDPPMPANQ